VALLNKEKILLGGWMNEVGSGWAEPVGADPNPMLANAFLAEISAGKNLVSTLFWIERWSTISSPARIEKSWCFLKLFKVY